MVTRMGQSPMVSTCSLLAQCRSSQLWMRCECTVVMRFKNELDGIVEVVSPSEKDFRETPWRAPCSAKRCRRDGVRQRRMCVWRMLSYAHCGRGVVSRRAIRNSVFSSSGDPSVQHGLPRDVCRWSSDATALRLRDILTMGEEDVREHASALVLASLGASVEVEGRVCHQGKQPQERGSNVVTGAVTSNNKRKRDGAGDDCHTYNPAPSAAITWPNLEFSASLRPLEVQVNLGGRRSGGRCLVTVANCIADSVVLGQTWEEASDMADTQTSFGSQHSLASGRANRTDASQSSQEPEPSQCSDWHFLASQTSSFVLEELPDSQPSSQNSASTFWG